MATKCTVLFGYLRPIRATMCRWLSQGVGLYRRQTQAADLRRSCVSKAYPQGLSWAKLSEASFARDWDNDKDAVYDKWRDLYRARPSRTHSLRRRR